MSSYGDIHRASKEEFSPPTSPQPQRLKLSPANKLSIELRTLLDALNTSVRDSEKDIKCLFRVDDSFSKLLHQFIENHCDKWVNGIILSNNVESILRTFLRLVRSKPEILTSTNKETAEKEINEELPLPKFSQQLFGYNLA